MWFPRMGAEYLVRRLGLPQEVPFAVIGDAGSGGRLSSLNRAAEAAGLQRGMGHRDAGAICAALITRSRDAELEEGTLAALRRWAGKFSPWVSTEPPDALLIDLTGCAHLFGGEAAVAERIARDCVDLGFSVTCGIADTIGAAWALARYADRGIYTDRSGDAIDQEARATRARAPKRPGWERVQVAPASAGFDGPFRIAPPGRTWEAIGPLPVAALRIDDALVTELGRVGLYRIADLLRQPRAGLSRRYGLPLMQRLDQAVGAVPEPLAAATPRPRFAVRLTLPDPIGLTDDVMAAVDRLLAPLCRKLETHGRGARRVRVECNRVDLGVAWAEIGLAAPTWEPARLRDLLRMKIDTFEAGYGIDAIRILATVTEPLALRQHSGHAEAVATARARAETPRPVEDLISRIGTRIGTDRVTRLHPADSHIPEKSCKTLSAAWSEPAARWPMLRLRRPVLLWTPEPVAAPARPGPPERFGWRGRDLGWAHASGPERIAPEWWLDDPNWRSGVRDYWRVTCDSGDRLWLYYAHGGAMSAGWFCQGSFA